MKRVKKKKKQPKFKLNKFYQSDLKKNQWIFSVLLNLGVKNYVIVSP